MSSSRDDVSSGVGENDPYAAVERAADLVWERVQQTLSSHEPDRISDRAVVLLMTAALKLYARKCDGEERSFRPLLGNRDEVVTPTEVLTAVTELLRAVRLGPTEFALWSRRRPEDYHESSPEIINLS
jgi:hypothetical protein